MCRETSWGVSTRLIGGIIMVHGDERAAWCCPRVAPSRWSSWPIAQHKSGVLEKAGEVYDALKAQGRAGLPGRPGHLQRGLEVQRVGAQGVPLRMEIGPGISRTARSPWCAATPWRSSPCPSRASPSGSTSC